VLYITQSLQNPALAHLVFQKLRALASTRGATVLMQRHDAPPHRDFWENFADEVGANLVWAPLSPPPDKKIVVATRTLLGAQVSIRSPGVPFSIVRGVLAPDRLLVQPVGSGDLLSVLYERDNVRLVGPERRVPALGAYEGVSFLSGAASISFGILLPNGDAVTAQGTVVPAPGDTQPSAYWPTPPPPRREHTLTRRDMDGEPPVREWTTAEVNAMISAYNKVRVFEFDMLDMQDYQQPPRSRDFKTFSGKGKAVENAFPFPNRLLRQHVPIGADRADEVRDEVRKWLGRRVCKVFDTVEYDRSDKAKTNTEYPETRAYIKYYGKVVGVFLGKVSEKTVRQGRYETRRLDLAGDDAPADDGGDQLFYCVQWVHVAREGQFDKKTGVGFFPTLRVSEYVNRTQLGEVVLSFDLLERGETAYPDANTTHPFLGYKMVDIKRTERFAQRTPEVWAKGRSPAFDWLSHVVGPFFAAKQRDKDAVVVARVFGRPHFYARVVSARGVAEWEFEGEKHVLREIEEAEPEYNPARYQRAAGKRGAPGGGEAADAPPAVFGARAPKRTRSKPSDVTLDFGPHYAALHGSRERTFSYDEARAAKIVIVGDAMRDAKAQPWLDEDARTLHNATLAWKYAHVESAATNMDSRLWLKRQDGRNYITHLGEELGLLWLHWPLMHALSNAMPRFRPGVHLTHEQLVSRIRLAFERTRRVVPPSVVREVGKLNGDAVETFSEAEVGERSVAFPFGYSFGWSTMAVPFDRPLRRQQAADAENVEYIDVDNDSAFVDGGVLKKATSLLTVPHALARFTVGVQEPETSLAAVVPGNPDAVWDPARAAAFAKTLRNDWSPNKDGLWQVAQTSLLLQVQLTSTYSHIGTRAHLRAAVASVTSTENPHIVSAVGAPGGLVVLDRYERRRLVFAAAEGGGDNGFSEVVRGDQTADTVYGMQRSAYDFAMADESGMLAEFTASLNGGGRGSGAALDGACHMVEHMYNKAFGKNDFLAEAVAVEMPLVNPFLMVAKAKEDKRCLFTQTQADLVLRVESAQDSFVVMVDLKTRMESSAPNLRDTQEFKQVWTNAWLFEAMTGVRPTYGALVMTTRRPEQTVFLVVFRLTADDTLSERSRFLCLLSPIGASKKCVYADRGSAGAFPGGLEAATESIAASLKTRASPPDQMLSSTLSTLHVVSALDAVGARPVEQAWRSKGDGRLKWLGAGPAWEQVKTVQGTGKPRKDGFVLFENPDGTLPVYDAEPAPLPPRAPLKGGKAPLKPPPPPGPPPPPPPPGPQATPPPPPPALPAPFFGRIRGGGQLTDLDVRHENSSESSSHAEARKLLSERVKAYAEKAYSELSDPVRRRLENERTSLANLNSLFRHMKAFLFTRPPPAGWETITAPRAGAAGQFDDLVVFGVDRPVGRMNHMNKPADEYGQPKERGVERPVNETDFQRVLKRTLNRLVNERVQRAFVVPDAHLTPGRLDGPCHPDVQVTRRDAITKFLHLSQRPFWSDAMVAFANEQLEGEALKIRLQLRSWVAGRQ
jgi:hypothetical protein